MKILVVDIGGTNVKVYATGHLEPVKIPSAATPCDVLAFLLLSAHGSFATAHPSGAGAYLQGLRLEGRR